MRRFDLVRKEDVSGVSGLGVVAEGVEFTDGTCVLRWFGKWPSSAFYSSLADLIAIHGHEGRTSVEIAELEAVLERLVWAAEPYIEHLRPEPGVKPDNAVDAEAFAALDAARQALQPDP